MAMQDLDKVLASGYEAKLPDLDWASMGIEDYKNLKTPNNVEAVPQLVEQWSNRPETGTRLMGFVEAPVKTASSEVTADAVAGVVACAKREMMKGLRGKELAEKLASLFPPTLIKASQEPLKAVASEQGLLGSVYIDMSVFDSCREAAQTLSPNRIRLADYAVGMPRKHVCSSHRDGFCKELRKTAVTEVPYGAELFDKYTKHLRVAGIITASESVTDKDTLRSALLKTPEVRRRTTSIELPPKEAAVQLKGTETLEQAIEKAASSREAAEAKYAGVRPVMEYMQNQMLRGIVGDDLRKAVGSRFSSDVVRSCKNEMSRLASLQGLLGTVYVDVGYYKSANEAVTAIATAKTKPSYVINTSPGAEYDGKLAAVSQATGCAPLPGDGQIDRKVAYSYLDDLRFSGRITPDSAKKYADLIEAGQKPLVVLREAFLSNERVDKSQKSAAQMGTWFSGTTRKVDDRQSLKEAAQKALDSGVPTDKLQNKLAGMVPTSEAAGMIHGLLSGMSEICATCLPHCSVETYPISKAARIKIAEKCKGCTYSTGSACLKQGVRFAGALDLDKAFFDMTAIEAAEKSEKKGDKKEKYDPKDETSPEVQKVLPKENPDVERSDMKQPYDMTDEFGSGGNKALEKLRESEQSEAKAGKDSKKKDK